LGTFKYHMMLREGVCSNRQSTVIWGKGSGVISGLSQWGQAWRGAH